MTAFNDQQSPCRNNICMQQISVDQVFDEDCGVYQSRRARRQNSQDH